MVPGAFESRSGIWVNKLVTKKLLVTRGIATRSKDPTRGSWPYY